MSEHVHEWLFSIRDAARWCGCGEVELTPDERIEDARARTQWHIDENRALLAERDRLASALRSTGDKE